MLFWDLTPSPSSAMKMEIACLHETLIPTYESTRHHIREHRYFHRSEKTETKMFMVGDDRLLGYSAV
jgi:hypothetical protein